MVLCSDSSGVGGGRCGSSGSSQYRVGYVPRGKDK